jgi:CheY-like chemotaxis protein
MPLKIMVVDDEAEVVKLIQRIVEPWGYEILALTDSREAAERMEREKFDGIVLDIMMPHLDGFELARRAKASPLNGQTPVIMVTGLNDIEAMRKCFGLGVTLFLNKPLSYDRLYNLFRAAKGPLLQEQRRNARLPFRTAIECTSGPQGEHHFRADSMNIGETGMLLEPSGGLDVGQELWLEFTLPLPPNGKEKTTVGGRRSRFADWGPPQAGRRRLRARVVRRVPPDTIAVRFVSPTAVERDLLQRFVCGRLMP